MTIKQLSLASILALAGLPAAAQQVEGTWNASVETPNGPMQFTFDLDVEGDELTGSMSNEFMGETPISNGMVDGNEVSFSLTIEGGPGGSMTINYEGEVEGDELMLTSTFEDGPPGGGPAEQTLTATRAE